AVLVGCLVRDDALAGVLASPEASADAELGQGDEDGADDDGADDDAVDDDGADGDGDERAPGWEAIDAALAQIYGDTEPHAHYGTVIPYMLGGNDPLHGISVYLRQDPVPHFHFVTYGFTDLFVKQTDDPEQSGFG